MNSIITLPDNFVASTTQVASTFFTDLGPYVTLVLGVLLGTAVLSILIRSIR